jgi:phage-related protein
MAATVVLTIIGNAASGMAALRNVQGELDKTARAARVVGAAFSALAAIGAGLIKNVFETAARTQVLGTSLRIVAEQAGLTEGQIAKLEKEIKSLGITTQQARSGMTRFIQSNLDLSKAAELARVAQDLGRIAGENSSETYNRLITAITTMNPRLLRQVNITANATDVFGKNAAAMDATVKKQMLLNFILAEGEKVSGVYLATVGDVGGAIASLPRLFEEVRNAIGKHFLPFVKVGVDLLKQLLKWFEMLPEPAQRMVAILLGLGTAFAALAGPLLLLVGFLPTILAGFASLVSILPILLPVLGALAAGVGAIVTAVVILKKAWDDNWGSIQDTVLVVGRQIKAWFGDIADDVKFWIGQIKASWNDLISAIKPLIAAAMQFIRSHLLEGSGLTDFLALLKDVLNVALKLVNQFLQSLANAIRGEEDAWFPLLDGFLNVVTLFALAWENWISKALRFGWNLVVELATGMAQAAREVLVTVLEQIGSLIRDFFGAFSPPKRGPLRHIAEWGRNLIDEYIGGFALADFGAIRDALAPIQEALESAVRVGDIEEADMIRILQRVRGLAVELFSEFRRTGEISESVMRQIADALGEGAKEYMDFIRLTLEYQASLGRLRAVEEEVIDAREKGFVPKELQDRLDAARKEAASKKEAVDWQRELLAFQQESVDLQVRLVETLEKLSEVLSAPAAMGGAEASGGIGEIPRLLDEIEKKPPIDLVEKLGLGELSEEFKSMKERVVAFFESLPVIVETWIENVKATLIAKWGEVEAALVAALRGLVVAVLDWIAARQQDVADAWQSVKDTIQEKLEEIAPVILDWIAAREQDIKEGWESIKTVIDDVLLTISQSILDWLAARQLDIVTGWENIKAAVNTVLLSISQLFLDWLAARQQDLTDGWENIKAAIGEKLLEITTTITDWLTSVEDSIVGAVDGFIQAGRDLINGLLSGLTEAWEGVKSWINSRIDDLPQWIKDALGISSPPDWAVTAGRDIVAGLRQGLDLSGLQTEIAGAINVNALAPAAGLGGSPTVVFAEGAFAGAFPGVQDGRDAESVMAQIQRLVEEGYVRAQVPGGVNA